MSCEAAGEAAIPLRVDLDQVSGTKPAVGGSNVFAAWGSAR